MICYCVYHNGTDLVPPIFGGIGDVAVFDDLTTHGVCFCTVTSMQISVVELAFTENNCFDATFQNACHVCHWNCRHTHVKCFVAVQKQRLPTFNFFTCTTCYIAFDFCSSGNWILCFFVFCTSYTKHALLVTIPVLKIEFESVCRFKGGQRFPFVGFMSLMVIDFVFILVMSRYALKNVGTGWQGYMTLKLE